MARRILFKTIAIGERDCAQCGYKDKWGFIARGQGGGQEEELPRGIRLGSREVRKELTGCQSWGASGWTGLARFFAKSGLRRWRRGLEEKGAQRSPVKVWPRASLSVCVPPSLLNFVNISHVWNVVLRHSVRQWFSSGGSFTLWNTWQCLKTFWLSQLKVTGE